MDPPAAGEIPPPTPPPQPPPSDPPPQTPTAVGTPSSSQQPSRYESQKRRDWNTFLQYLKTHKPGPLTLARCSGAHVLEFLKYLDQFGKTKVHGPTCAFFGHPNPPGPCPCPLRQAWGSLDALIGRLRAAYEETGGRPENNPFAAAGVRIYLREVRDTQSKARGIPYEKKKRKRHVALAAPPSCSSSSAVAGGGAATAAVSGGGVTVCATVPTPEDSAGKGGGGGEAAAGGV